MASGDNQAFRPNDSTQQNGTQMTAIQSESPSLQRGADAMPRQGSDAGMQALLPSVQTVSEGHSTVTYDQGKPKEYDNNNYSLAKHDDGKWYFNQKGSDRFVPVDGNSIKDDHGKITFNESGLFGKNNQTLGDGSTGFLSSITSAGSNVAHEVVHHPFNAVNRLALAPLTLLDAAAGTHVVNAVSNMEKGAMDELIHHPGKVATDVLIGAGIGALTVATGGALGVALGVGALGTTELIKNKGDIGGVVSDARNLGKTIGAWGHDFATVAGKGPHSEQEQQAAEQGLRQAGAFGLETSAGILGGISGGFAASAAGLDRSIPNAIRSMSGRGFSSGDSVGSLAAASDASGKVPEVSAPGTASLTENSSFKKLFDGAKPNADGSRTFEVRGHEVRFDGDGHGVVVKVGPSGMETDGNVPIPAGAKLDYKPYGVYMTLPKDVELNRPVGIFEATGNDGQVSSWHGNFPSGGKPQIEKAGRNYIFHHANGWYDDQVKIGRISQHLNTPFGLDSSSANFWNAVKPYRPTSVGTSRLPSQADALNFINAQNSQEAMYIARLRMRGVL